MMMVIMITKNIKNSNKNNNKKNKSKKKQETGKWKKKKVCMGENVIM